MQASSKIGYVYDERMLLHSEGEVPIPMPETPFRISSFHSGLQHHPHFNNLQPIQATPLNPDLAKRVHKESLVERLLDLKFDYSDIMNPKPRASGVKYSLTPKLYDNEHTSDCIFLSCGGTVNAIDAILNNTVSSAIANIRPPGHHASFSEVGGFCFLNNVAVAVKKALDSGTRKVLIFDWDVHHGNGTQEIFEKDDRVLYISIHRYDDGRFYPFNPKACHSFTGTATGKGFSVNIAWNTECDGESVIGNGDYVEAFDRIVMPVALEFAPELVVVSAGFDAMRGDPVGMLSVDEEVYEYMISELRFLAGGRIAIVLEGGYSLECLEKVAFSCLKGLEEPVERQVFPVSRYGEESIVRTYEAVSEFWSMS